MPRKPRASQIALLATVGALAALVVALVASVYFQRIHMPLRHTAAALSTAGRVSERPDFRDFREIVLTGRWRAELARGEDWRVELVHPEVFTHLVRRELRGHRLELEFDPPFLSDDSGILAIARITMPELGLLVVRGYNQVQMQDLGGDRLTLDVQGNNLVEAGGGAYGALDLSVTGRNRLYLGAMPVRDAEVQVTGNTSITLSMDGGTLSGFLAGAGILGYRGTVSAESVRVTGVARIHRLD